LLYSFEDFVLDTGQRELHRGSLLIAVQPQVFDILEYLVANRHRVISKDDLIEAVWGGRIVSESALTTRINAARTAVSDSGERQRLIRTLPRKGFRFVGEVREAPQVPVPAEEAAASQSAAPSGNKAAAAERRQLTVVSCELLLRAGGGARTPRICARSRATITAASPIRRAGTTGLSPTRMATSLRSSSAIRRRMRMMPSARSVLGWS